MSKSNGEIIKIQFDENISCSSFDEITDHFLISFDTYDMAPNGNIVLVEKNPVSISIENDILTMTFNSGVDNSFQRAIGVIAIAYDGGALIVGEENPLPAFSTVFTPEDLDPKNNPNYAEHSEIKDISATCDLVAVGWTDTQDAEHVEIKDISVDGKLTHVDDI